MSQHDLVSAQNHTEGIVAPFYLQCLHAALNAIAYIAYIVCVKQFVMSLPAWEIGSV